MIKIVNVMSFKIMDLNEPERTLILKYKGEDNYSILVAGQNGECYRIPKNRNVQKPLAEQSHQTLTPAFRILMLAFFGLAPAGLGTLVLAPLAAVWALVIWVTHPLPRADILRVILILGFAAGLLAIAIPLSNFILARLL